MNKLQQLFSQIWAIRDEDYKRIISFLLPSIKSGNLPLIEEQLSAKTITAYATMPYIADRWELDDASIPKNSVAVLTVEGVLYSWETYRLENLIKQALSNSNISGIVLFVNGPGGMILRVDLLEKLIRESAKPIAAYITGVCASAHFWFVSACQRTFISSPMDKVGSVGIIYTYQNFKNYYKELGIEMEDIYPDSADLKNKMIREMDENHNPDLIKKELSFYHNIFSQTIATNLGVAYDPKLPLFRGDTFFAGAAVANGYIDQLGTLEDAIEWVLGTAVAKQTKDII